MVKDKQPQMPAAEPDPQSKQSSSSMVVELDQADLAETGSIDENPAASKKQEKRSRKGGKT